MPGVPSVYYGSEWGIKGEKGNGANTDDAIRPQLELTEMLNCSQELVKHIKELSNIRKASNAIKYGGYEELYVSNEQMAFARYYDDEVVILAFNLSDSKIRMAFNYKGESYEFFIDPHSYFIM